MKDLFFIVVVLPILGFGGYYYCRFLLAVLFASIAWVRLKVAALSAYRGGGMSP